MKHARKPGGFTLIELIIAIAVIGILLAVAIPSYRDSVLRSQVRTAQNDLLALAANAENILLRQLAYPTASAANTAAVQTAFAGWRPAQGNFTYAYTPTLTSGRTTAYALTATGTGELSTCVLTLTDRNVRTMAGCRVMRGSTW